MKTPARHHAERWVDSPVDRIRLDLATDSEWLSRLAGYDVDRDTIEYANELVAKENAASTDGNDYAQQAAVYSARRAFYEEVLFWHDEKHTHHSMFEKMQKANPELMPLHELVSYERENSESGKLEELAIRKVDSFDERTAPAADEFVYLDASDKECHLAAQGLDVKAVLKHAAYIKNFSKETVDERMRTITEILGALGVRYSAADIVNVFPPVLMSRSEKLRALTGIMASDTNQKYIASLKPQEAARYITPPIDAVLAAVAKQRTQPRFAPYGLSRQNIVDIQKVMPKSKSERREHSLEILSDLYCQKKLGNHAIRSYAHYKPFSFNELNIFPDLTAIVKEIGSSAVMPEVRSEEALLHPLLDRQWLSKLAGYDLEDEDIERANRLMAIGSINMNHASDALKLKIAETRREFFDNILLWGYKNHPLHKTYEHIRQSKPSLAPLSTMITIYRTLNVYDVDIPYLLTKTRSLLLGTSPETLDDRIATIVELGLEPKQLFKGEYRTLHVSSGQMREVVAVFQATDGLNASKILGAVPRLLTIKPMELASRIGFLLERGIDIAAVSRNPSLLTISVATTQERIAFFEQRGLDAIKILSGARFAFRTSEQLIDKRINALKDAGLNATDIVNKWPNVLNLDADIPAKLVVVRDFLRVLGSPLSAEQFVNENPGILARSEQKLLATAEIVADAIDPEFIKNADVAKLEALAKDSVDTIFAAVVEGKTSPRFAKNGVTSSDFRRIQKNIAVADRRRRNLESLADPAVRGVVGSRAVEAYLAYLPLTPGELERYPKFAEVNY